MTDYYVDPAQDGTSGYDANTSFISRKVYTSTPYVEDQQYVDFNLSGIGASETITAVSIRLHQFVYNATKGLAKTYSVQHVASGPTITVLLDGITFTASATWYTLGNIGVFVKSTNVLRVVVTDPPDAKYRYMEGYTSEYATAGSRPQLLVVTTVPSTGERRSYIIMAG